MSIKSMPAREALVKIKRLIDSPDPMWGEIEGALNELHDLVYTEGRDFGLQEGQARALVSGHDQGMVEGYQLGYNTGFAAGHAQASTAATLAAQPPSLWQRLFGKK